MASLVPELLFYFLIVTAQAPGHRRRDPSRRDMISVSFEEDVWDVWLAPGAMMLGGWDLA
jgi:hypothetical protein